MNNKGFRDYAKSRGIYLWEVAIELGVCQATVTRKLRFPMSESDEKKYRNAVDKIYKRKNGFRTEKSSNSYLLENIKDILSEHIGEENAIKSKEISTVLGLPLEDTQFLTRQLIKNALEKFKIPVVSSVNGYFIPKNEDELKSYNMQMQKRINGIENRRRKINANYNKWIKQNVG